MSPVENYCLPCPPKLPCDYTVPLKLLEHPSPILYQELMASRGALIGPNTFEPQQLFPQVVGGPGRVGDGG